MKNNNSSLLTFTSGFRRVHYGIFLGLCLVSGWIAVTALRHNNQHMIELREAVYQADKNNSDVNTALNKLRLYVYSHMNTDLSSGNNAIKPPIQLKYTYERLTAGEKTQADAANARIYTDAQAYCQQQNSVAFSGRTRVPCIEDYVTTHGNKPNSVPTALYQYDFVSPSWSPDLAGWSLAFSVAFFLAFLVSFVDDRALGRRVLKEQRG